mgnify:CR=1 FL=1
MKRLFFFVLLGAGAVSSMEKPPRLASGQPPKESEFLKLVHKDPSKAMEMIENGYLITYAELFHLTAMNDERHKPDNIYFWLNRGVEFLRNARIKPSGAGVDSLRSLAAKKASRVISKESGKAQGIQKQFNQLPAELQSLVISQDRLLINRTWKNLLGQLENKDPQLALKALEQIVVLWTALLNTPNTLLAQKLLQGLMTKTKRFKKETLIGAKLTEVIRSLVQLLAAAQCQNVQNIIEYLRAKQLLIQFHDPI